MASRYWVVSLPVQNSATSLWNRLQEQISKHSFDTPLYRVVDLTEIQSVVIIPMPTTMDFLEATNPPKRETQGSPLKGVAMVRLVVHSVGGAVLVLAMKILEKGNALVGHSNAAMGLDVGMRLNVTVLVVGTGELSVFSSMFCSGMDMICSFLSIVGDPSKGFFCYAQGYSTHFFCVASFLWTTTIAFTLHRTVVRHKTDVEDLEAMFHLYVWGTSLVMTVIRSIGNDHGHLGAWCWTQTGRTGKAVHFITFYAPLWGAILYNGFTYFQVIRMLNNATRMAVGMSDRAYQMDSRADMKALNRWGYYPLILIGSWAFGTINRIHDFIEPGHKIFWLSFLDVGTAALMGLFNSIAYGLNSSVRRAIYERLDLFWPERLPRWFHSSLKFRNQQQESELVSLKIQDQL